MFSVDGYKTPEELVDLAVAEGIRTFSITDHNHLGGQERAMRTAADRGLDYITGVEMDCIWKGKQYHFLCYGFDLEDAAMVDITSANSDVYVRDFEVQWKRIEARAPGITLDDLRERLPERYPTHPSPELNRWSAQDLFIEKGIVANEVEYQDFWVSIIAETEASGDAESVPSWASYESVRDAVHAAGGLVLLAHVGYYVGPQIGGDPDAQLETIHGALEDGCDGFELYHPALMAEPHFGELEREAERLDCAVSGGSDRHTGVRGVAPDWVAESLRERLCQQGQETA